MSERLRARFAAKQARFVAYLACGDPSLAVSVEIVLAAARAGADVIELGMPFSDPSADGPVIQLAMERALAGGATVAGTLDVVRQVRQAGCDVPIVLFGYFNPVFIYGVERFAKDAAAAGADAILIVDLPVEEIDELARPARAAGLDVVPLLSPTSSPERMRKVAALDAPFIYYVSITGITGAALSGLSDIARRVREVKEVVKAPVAVGFGISTPDDARAMGRVADAVVVGSAIVRAIEQHPDRAPAAVAELVSALKAAL
jgi:tryptophan synthase alpha chain